MLVDVRLPAAALPAAARRFCVSGRRPQQLADALQKHQSLFADLDGFERPVSDQFIDFGMTDPDHPSRLSDRAGKGFRKLNFGFLAHVVTVCVC